MKTRTLTVCLLVFLLVAGIFIAGCTTTSAQAGTGSSAPAVTQAGSSQGAVAQSSSSPKILRMADLSAITSIDPASSGVFVTEKAMITEPLVGATQDFVLTPKLASSWKQTSPTTWEFKLRDDVKFHNGKPMTASEVKFSLDRTSKENSQSRQMADYKSSRVIDDHTIEVTTNRNNPILPAVLHYSNFGIIHPDSLNAQGNFSIPVGTGPMMYDSFDQQTRVFTVKKNPDYWAGTVKLDGVVFSSVPDHSSRTLAIEKGDIDFTVDLPYNEAERIDALPGINVEKYLTPRVYILYVNFDRAPLQDLRLRKALSLAINRTDIVNHVLYGVGQPARGFFLPSMSFGNKNLDELQYDPVKAKALLAEMGYKDTNGDGIVEKDGQPLTIDLITATNRPALAPMLETIGSDLKAIGIQPKVEVMASAAQTDRVTARTYDLQLVASNIAMVPDPGYILPNWFKSNGPTNSGKWKNATMDAEIDDAFHTADDKERLGKWNKIEADAYDLLPVIPVADYGVLIVKKDTVQGYKFDPTAHDYALGYEITITE
ncbi:MAG: ABC transporter substrate-binding protein [Methanoregula sp.]